MEIHKKVEFEGHDLRYTISNYGNIIGMGRNKFGQILKPVIDKYGYHYKTLTCFKCKKKMHFFIHRLVMQAFNPQGENKLTVNHIDGNKLNNNLSNLEWCTAAENRTHALKTGLFNPKGENNTFAVLTEEQVLKIRAEGKYSTYAQIAKDNNMSANAIVEILKRKTWKHI